MNSRALLVVPLLALAVGIVLGLYVATYFADPPPAASSGPVLRLSLADQEDYIFNTADAYAADANLKLAQDRLARLQDPNIAGRVETLALAHASERTNTSSNLARLAVALGSPIHSLVALYVTATFTPTHTRTPKHVILFSSVRASIAPTDSASPTPSETPEPEFVVVPNDHPFIILPTNTPTITPTRRPTRIPTRTPTSTDTPTATAVPPAPYPEFYPGFPDRWPPGVYFAPADVQPGQQYWHLTKAIYCDFVENNFGCPDMPGNRDGTSIYVMDHQKPIHVFRPGGRDVGDQPSQVGDLKRSTDVCLCSWAILVSDYKISVNDGASDALGGFSLYTVGGNVLAGHAHVRYFLYFDQITR